MADAAPNRRNQGNRRGILIRNTACAIRSLARFEHPFDTIKAWMGATHFQIRRLRNVHTEIALHVLAYNIKRMIELSTSHSLLRDPHTEIGNIPEQTEQARPGKVTN